MSLRISSAITIISTQVSLVIVIPSITIEPVIWICFDKVSAVESDDFIVAVDCFLFFMLLVYTSEGSQA